MHKKVKTDLAQQYNDFSTPSTWCVWLGPFPVQFSLSNLLELDRSLNGVQCDLVLDLKILSYLLSNKDFELKTKNGFSLNLL